MNKLDVRLLFILISSSSELSEFVRDWKLFINIFVYINKFPVSYKWFGLGLVYFPIFLHLLYSIFYLFSCVSWLKKIKLPLLLKKIWNIWLKATIAILTLWLYFIIKIYSNMSTKNKIIRAKSAKKTHVKTQSNSDS